MNKDLQGKVFLITGGTNGIGYAATKNFAERGADITLIGRNQEKTEKIVKELKQLSNNNHIDYILCDLTNLNDIKQAVDKFKAKKSQLDVLVNNAGATFKKPKLGKNGYEITFTLNHLAHFKLTHYLLDLIKNTPRSRVISTSSSMQARGKIDLKTLPFDTQISGPTAYANSKLTNILFIKGLQKRLEGTSATANCFAPGMVKTNFGAFGGSDQGCLINLVYKLAKPFAISLEEGADSLIWLATSKEATHLKGEYISKRKVLKPSKQALNPELIDGLWSLSEKLCEN